MLIQAMGDIGCKKALPVIREYLGSEKTVIHIASIKALSVWPDSAPLEDLRKVLESSEDIKAHSLAMNGYIRLIQIDNAMSEEEKSEAFKHAMELAKNIDEKRVVVSGLSSVRTKSAFQMAVGLLENPELRPEAEAAISSIAGSLGRIDPDYTRKELNRIIEATDNPEFKARLQEILKWMD
jgi:HEAT repeat protein